MKYRLVYLLSFIAVVSFVFYACGDEDSSSTSLAPTADLTQAAAGNTPRAGSVIQGSRAGSDGVTDDLVTVDDDGSVSVDGIDSVVRFEPSGLSSSIESGFYSYTDDDGAAWGMFVDGEETADGSFPTLNTCYSGNAVVYHDITNADGTVEQPRRSMGTVRLTFDQTISGEITGIPTGRDDEFVTVTLGGASPDATTNLYSGDTVLQDVPGASENGEGKWGVQFFNDGNTVVLAGTWGGTVSNEEEGLSSSAVGVLVVRPAACPSN